MPPPLKKKTLATSAKLLDDYHLFNVGYSTAIIGESGVGKTTLLSSLICRNSSKISLPIYYYFNQRVKLVKEYIMSSTVKINYINLNIATTLELPPEPAIVIIDDMRFLYDTFPYTVYSQFLLDLNNAVVEDKLTLLTCISTYKKIYGKPTLTSFIPALEDIAELRCAVIFDLILGLYHTKRYNSQGSIKTKEGEMAVSDFKVKVKDNYVNILRQLYILKHRQKEETLKNLVFYDNFKHMSEFTKASLPALKARVTKSKNATSK